ncbi:MAG TPA: hypothetical protein VI385_16175 [Flavisolibacter sp.]|jgi:hypothetical protein
MKKFLILAVAASSFIFACDKDKNKDKEYKSDEVTLHGGKVWTSAKVDKDGKPLSVSILVNDAALNSVPVGQPSDHMSPQNNILIPISDKSGTPFRFAMVNWNSSGHEPDNVYTVPHFDFHFYTSNQADVMNYMDDAKLNAEPPAGYIPANHISGPGVPMMGKHFIDANTPELHGQPFTQTFLYGSYDSKVVFMEPMITLAFLKNTTTFERSIPQPTKFQQAGFYPTKMKVSRHDGVTEITLEDFVSRQAS